MKNNFALTFEQTWAFFPSLSAAGALTPKTKPLHLPANKLMDAGASIQRTRLSALAERLIIMEWRKNVYVVQRVS
jgi:hypothetical protein